MSKEYLSGLKIRKDYQEDNQIFLKKRVYITFNNLLKTFFNKQFSKDEKLIDLGAANGAFVKVANQNGLISVGLDIDELNFETDKIKLDSNKYDYVTAISLIEHLHNPKNLLNEILRILKPGGFFILVTPNWSYSYKNFYDDPTHVQPYTKKSLNFLLKIHGFSNIKIVPWLVCKPLWMWKIPFSFLLARLIPFGGVKDNKNYLIPSFLKGKSKTLLAVCKKQDFKFKN